MGIGNVMVLSFDFAPPGQYRAIYPSLFRGRMMYGWKRPLRFHQCDTINSIVVVLDQVNTAVDLWVLGILESMEETVVLSHVSIISTSALTAVLLLETDSSREGFKCFSCRFIQCLWPNSHISFHATLWART